MITIVTALYQEAKPFIASLGLVKRPEEHMYQHFASDTSDIEVVITGAGYATALRSLSRHLALHAPSSGSVIVNVGICGASAGSVGDLFLINKITDAATGRAYFPDLLFRSSFAQASLTTSHSVVSSGTGLYDTEAAALFEASSPYVTAERMVFFKVISDKLDPSAPVDPESLISRHLSSILDYVRSIPSFGHELPMPDLTPVISMYSLTSALTEKLSRAVKYRLINGQDTELSFFDTEDLNSKAEKKRVFEKKLLEYIEASELSMKPQITSPSLNPPFTNVYVEEGLAVPPVFADHNIIRISDYRDIFNRGRQNFDLQKKSPALIVARRSGGFVFKGAKVCQSFGNSHFYYCSVMMNCVFDCEYCYLAGMYPSGNVVAFMNFDELLSEIDGILSSHPMYLCVSYDTDLLAAEKIFGYVGRFIEACKTRPDLTIEVRTKSGDASVFDRFEALPNVIFAWTLSPEALASASEIHASPVSHRISAMARAASLGFKVRVCFDPLIRFPGWEEAYSSLVDSVFDSVSPASVFDCSIGSFRISTEYLKLMRRRRPGRALTEYPYVSTDGVSHCGDISGKMVSFVRSKVASYIGDDKIFIWEENS